MSRRLEFHPLALREAEVATQWYLNRSPVAADGFIEEMQGAAQAISAAPLRHAAYLHGTRRYLLKKYPYLVVFRVTETAIRVLAVAHGRRRPGYWRGR